MVVLVEAAHVIADGGGGHKIEHLQLGHLLEVDFDGGQAVGAFHLSVGEGAQACTLPGGGGGAGGKAFA